MDLENWVIDDNGLNVTCISVAVVSIIVISIVSVLYFRFFKAIPNVEHPLRRYGGNFLYTCICTLAFIQVLVVLLGQTMHTIWPWRLTAFVNILGSQLWCLALEAHSLNVLASIYTSEVARHRLALMIEETVSSCHEVQRNTDQPDQRSPLSSLSVDSNKQIISQVVKSLPSWCKYTTPSSLLYPMVFLGMVLTMLTTIFAVLLSPFTIASLTLYLLLIHIPIFVYWSSLAIRKPVDTLRSSYRLMLAFVIALPLYIFSMGTALASPPLSGLLLCIASTISVIIFGVPSLLLSKPTIEGANHYEANATVHTQIIHSLSCRINPPEKFLDWLQANHAVHLYECFLELYQIQKIVLSSQYAQLFHFHPSFYLIRIAAKKRTKADNGRQAWKYLDQVNENNVMKLLETVWNVLLHLRSRWLSKNSQYFIQLDIKLIKSFKADIIRIHDELKGLTVSNKHTRDMSHEIQRSTSKKSSSIISIKLGGGTTPRAPIQILRECGEVLIDIQHAFHTYFCKHYVLPWIVASGFIPINEIAEHFRAENERERSLASAHQRSSTSIHGMTEAAPRRKSIDVKRVASGSFRDLRRGRSLSHPQAIQITPFSTQSKMVRNQTSLETFRHYEMPEEIKASRDSQGNNLGLVVAMATTAQTIDPPTC